MRSELVAALDYRCIMSGVVFDVYGSEMPEVPSASVLLTPGPASEKFLRQVDPTTVLAKSKLNSDLRRIEMRVLFKPSCQGITHFDVEYSHEWIRLNDPAHKIWSLQFYMPVGSYALARVFHIERPDGAVLLDSGVQHVDAVANFSKILSPYNSLH